MLVFVALVLICSPLFAWSVSRPGSAAPVAPTTRVVVQPGDTLWGVAEEYGPAHEDVRSIVYRIKQVNRLDTSLIHPGDVLLVPQNRPGVRSVRGAPVAGAQPDGVSRGSGAR